MKILDSNFIIAILKEDTEALAKIKELEEDRDVIATTVFNEQEVLFGVLNSKKMNDYKTTMEFLDTMTIIPYERRSVAATVRIQLELKSRGHSIGTMDELIAGICLSYGASIVTRNDEHFSRIPRLKVEKW